MDWQEDEADPREFMKAFRTDLFDEEVYVFTPKGEVKVLPAGATPIDFAYAVHTDVGHRTVGAKINGRIVPLHYRLKNGDFVEILTTKSGRGPSRDWLSLAESSRARNKIRQWFSRETREETEQKGRETLETALEKQNLPYKKLQRSSVLAQVIRTTGFTKASWDGGATQSFRVQIAVDSWDRPRLLEDVARTFAEHGANIVEYGGHVEDQLAKNWYVAEVGDVKALRSLLTALRNLDAVFDAFRVTPS